jgi:hypothetical protein
MENEQSPMYGHQKLPELGGINTVTYNPPAFITVTSSTEGDRNGN